VASLGKDGPLSGMTEASMVGLNEAKRMSGRGGRRLGAGRPPGSKNQRTVEIARAAVEAGITPLEVMLNAMRELWDEGTPESKREAAAIAKDAAPYVHPRLSNIDQNINEIQPYACVRSIAAQLRNGKLRLERIWRRQRLRRAIHPNGRAEPDP
jgi:hypothetical protein